MGNGTSSARLRYSNVALTASLAELHAEGRIADVVRFHRYRPCVLLGRSQNAATVTDLGYCRRHGIDIARRVTGGGAVFMSPRMLAWDVLLDRSAWGGDLRRVTAAICEGVAAGLARLGVASQFRAPNDIEIGGRKISGSGGYTEGRSAVLQGTVLIENETGMMAGALGIAEDELRAGVTCLHEAAKAVLPMASVTAAISAGLCDSLERRASTGNLEPAERARCEEFLRSDDEGFLDLARAAS